MPEKNENPKPVESKPETEKPAANNDVTPDPRLINIVSESRKPDRTKETLAGEIDLKESKKKRNK